MNAEAFLDTNLFIYQLEYRDAFKASIAEDLIFKGIDDGTACISFQVVQECINTVRRKAEIPLDTFEVQRYLETVLFPLWAVMPSQNLYMNALHIEQRYDFGFYDSLIIASAIDSGCTKLYTEDLQHGQRIQSLQIINPFLHKQ
ncbi:MAG: PIN domain-containing protein [Desulfohalobiaceae bacterium]